MKAINLKKNRICLSTLIIGNLFVLGLLSSTSTIQNVFSIQDLHAGKVSKKNESVFFRFVPERKDDFAFENDLIAFRVYGPALRDSIEDSGFDCWMKRVTYPIIDKWYKENSQGKSYHQDSGEGYDGYSVGDSRGCGGLAIWDQQANRMIPSDTFTTWRIISLEKARGSFELDYEWMANGKKITETKRISLELGKRLFRVDSTFKVDGKPQALDIAIGLVMHEGKNGKVLKYRTQPKKGYIYVWEQIDKMGLGTGVVIDPKRVVSMQVLKENKKQYATHLIITTKVQANQTLTYYAGYGWAKANEITNHKKWDKYLKNFIKKETF